MWMKLLVKCTFLDMLECQYVNKGHSCHTYLSISPSNFFHFHLLAPLWRFFSVWKRNTFSDFSWFFFPFSLTWNFAGAKKKSQTVYSSLKSLSNFSKCLLNIHLNRLHKNTFSFLKFYVSEFKGILCKIFTFTIVPYGETGVVLKIGYFWQSGAQDSFPIFDNLASI